MAQDITIAFMGNPNCGKTTLFNAYTGANLKVANWPGVTVERVEGAIRDHDMNLRLVDLPGTYSLTSYTMVTDSPSTVPICTGENIVGNFIS